MSTSRLTSQLEASPPCSACEATEALTVNRRDVLIAGAATSTLALVSGEADAQPASATVDASSAQLPTSEVKLEVNGQRHAIRLDNRTTLLDALREHLHLSGTKKGCDHGQCGACTVLVGGRRINACLSLAVMHDGDSVTTIEGLGTPEKLHPMQAAFVRHDGYQCGYCTPGQICSAVGVVAEIRAGVPSHVTTHLTSAPPLTADELRERMSGNICRCGAYSNIVDAIADVAGMPA